MSAEKSMENYLENGEILFLLIFILIKLYIILIEYNY